MKITEGEAPKIANVTCYFVSDYITAAQAGNADYVYGNAADMVEALEGRIIIQSMKLMYCSINISSLT